MKTHNEVILEEKIARIKEWLDKWGYSKQKELPDSFAANVRESKFNWDAKLYEDMYEEIPGTSLADMVYSLFE